MPHIQIEYSKNLEQHLDMGCFCEDLRAEAIKIEAFPMPGVRVRAIGVDHYAIADGQPNHGFMDISVRLREGRSQEVKRDAVQRIFDRAKSLLEPVMANHSVALSIEMRDINKDLSPKTGTIRDHLEQKS